MMDCLFCKIVDRVIPAKIVHETDSVLGFLDINPQAPIHVLFIPKQHIETVDACTDPAVFGALASAARDHARSLGVAEAGYRLVMNCNPEGGQTVYHLHLHLLAGRQLRGLG